MSAPSPRPVEVLLVEDDEQHARVVREALTEGTARSHLSVIANGPDVISYLRGEGDHPGIRRPDLILLDLDVPGRDGFQVLADIKAQPELRPLPVVVLTASRAEADVVRSYDLQADAYVSKPADLHDFVEAIRRIDEFFISVVRLPLGDPSVVRRLLPRHC
jgi:CheY-like chemotaxis protein